MDNTKRIISTSILQDTANAIRAKKESSNQIKPINFADEIASIETSKPTQTKSVTPTTSQQLIEPDTGYELASVTVNAVTNSIDANITANNIKKDISILGITGTLSSISASRLGGNDGISKLSINGTNYSGVKPIKVGDIVYIFFGRKGSGSSWTDNNDVLTYDLKTNTVQKVGEVTIGDGGVNSDVMGYYNNKIYLWVSVKNGYDWLPYGSICSYDITTNTTVDELVSLPDIETDVHKYPLTYATIGSNIYIFGCYRSDNYARTGEVYKIDILTKSSTLTTTITEVSSYTIPNNIKLKPVYENYAVYINLLESGLASNKILIYNTITDTYSIETILENYSLLAYEFLGTYNDLFLGYVSDGSSNYICAYSVVTKKMFKIPVNNFGSRPITLYPMLTYNDGVYSFGTDSWANNFKVKFDITW